MGSLAKLPKNWKEFLSVDENKDTGVVAIAVAAVSEISADELRIAFGTAHKFRYITVHEIAQRLRPQKSAVLYVFHTITGCDTVSSFNCRGEKTAW